jgi:hypothetical protein
MITEDRLRNAMAACRNAIETPTDFFDQLHQRAERIRRQRRIRALAAAAAAIIVLAGAVVGLQQGRSHDSAVARLRQDFAASANQICNRATLDVRAVRPAGNPTFAELVAAGQRAALIDQAAITALRSLVPPPTDRVAFEAMLTQFDQTMGASLVVMAVLESKGGQRSSPEVMAAIEAATTATAKAAQLARDDGVPRCAELIYPTAY